MKKVTYLVVLMFSLVLTSTSCCKEDGDDPVVPTQITAADLVGEWNFVSLEIGGNTYVGGCSDALRNSGYNVGALDLNFAVSPNVMTYYSLCAADPTAGFDSGFTFSNNEINFDNGNFVFKIDNASTFLSGGKTTLKLKLLSTNFFINAPINGIYTFTK